MLKSIYRIKKNREFRYIFQHSRGIPSRYLVVYYRRHERPEPRFGFVVSKKVGGAVIRNRVRRVLREMVRKNVIRIRPGVDIIFIARPAIKGIKGTEVEQVLLKLLNKIGLLSD
ncbi:MAG: ribonuclease P protein component [Peptococcaceae bacterium]|nr:ribonuclease P protein component [Peptococcaceae bacterium]